jgi:hypothetical protein
VEHLKSVLQGCARRRKSERRGTLGYFQEILKEEESDGQDLVERIGEIRPAVGSTKEARRLRPHQEVNLGRIVSHRIVVGLPVSHSIREELHWG